MIQWHLFFEKLHSIIVTLVLTVKLDLSMFNTCFLFNVYLLVKVARVLQQLLDKNIRVYFRKCHILLDDIPRLRDMIMIQGLF